MSGLVNSIKIRNKHEKSFCKENDLQKNKLMKDNSEYKVILYLHFICRQENAIVKTLWRQQKSWN